MEVKFELSKYDILGMASMIGASEENLEKIEKYINENDTLNINYINVGDNGYTELKSAISAVAVAQISKELNL